MSSWAKLILSPTKPFLLIYGFSKLSSGMKQPPYSLPTSHFNSGGAGAVLPPDPFCQASMSCPCSRNLCGDLFSSRQRVPSRGFSLPTPGSREREAEGPAPSQNPTGALSGTSFLAQPSPGCILVVTSRLQRQSKFLPLPCARTAAGDHHMKALWVPLGLCVPTAGTGSESVADVYPLQCGGLFKPRAVNRGGNTLSDFLY